MGEGHEGGVGPGWDGVDLLAPAGGGRVLQEHHAAAGGSHLRGGSRGEVEPAQAHCSAHGHDGRSQAGHVSGTGVSSRIGPLGHVHFYWWGWGDQQGQGLPPPPPTAGPVTTEWGFEGVTLGSLTVTV